MAGVEVVGIIAAIPGLVDLVQKAARTTRQLASQKAFRKETTNLLYQLELIESTLNDVSSKFRRTSPTNCHISWLSSAITALKNDLVSLNNFLSTRASLKDGSRLLERARLFLSSFDGKIKEYRERLERTKSSLTLAIAEETLAISRTNIRLELQRILRPCGHNFIPSSLPGTCEWIWTHPTFCQWLSDSSRALESENNRLMCIYGTKGCGKSVLAGFITERLKSQGKVAILFSFWYGSESQQKLLDLLRTLLWNLLQKVPDNELTGILDSLMDDQPLNENTLRNAIRKVIALINTQVYCVIDGIDESADDWTSPDHGSLSSILQLTIDKPGLRVLFLGRESSVRTITANFPLKIEITEELVQNDINKLIRSELDRSLKIQTPEIKELVQRTLQENSRMMFLWITLIFKELSRCHLPSEIICTLGYVPRDLDREYHRLFARLLERFGGSSSNPSVPLQRVKRLLSLILAAPEPLTCIELQYAFAMSENPKEGFEEHLIGNDGIIDSCGDLVQISEGRYHIVHASVAEFLTRSIDKWKFEDENIIFFHIDPLEAQKDICVACLNYLSINDLGYPIVDDSLTSLPAKLPFFSYASHFLPWHLMNIYSAHIDPIVDSRVDSFINSPQFCAFLEYLTITFQENSLSVARHYLELDLHFSLPEYSSQASYIMTKIPIVARSFERELRCREERFGVYDVRYQTWISLANVIAMYYDFESEIDNFALRAATEKQDSHPEEITGRNTLDTLGPVTGNYLQAIPSGMIQDVTMMIGGAKYVMLLKSMANGMSLFAYISSITPAHLLPTSYLILLALTLPRLEQSIDYMSVACMRLKNKHSSLESFCLLNLSWLLSEQDAMNRRTQVLLRQALEIATGLRQNPHVVMLTCVILHDLTQKSFRHEKDEEACGTAALLEELLATASRNENANGWWERRFYRRGFWADFQAHYRADLARLYHYNGYYKEAVAIGELAIPHYENMAKPSRMKLITYWNKACSLYSLGRYEESEDACRVLLRNINILATTDGNGNGHDIFLRWAAPHKIGMCLFLQGRESEARQWVSQIDLDSTVGEERRTLACLWNLGRLLMWTDEFKRAEVVFRKALLASKVVLPAGSSCVSDHRLESLTKSLSDHRPKVGQWKLICTCFDLGILVANECIGMKHENETESWRTRALLCCEDESVFYNIWDAFYLKYIGLKSSDKDTTLQQMDQIYRELELLYELIGEYKAAGTVFDHLKTLYIY